MRRFNVFYKMAPGTRDAFLKDLMDNRISECALAIDGCIQYQYMVPVDDPNTLVLMEKWKTEDARQTHIAAPHFAKIQELKGTRVIGWESEEY